MPALTPYPGALLFSIRATYRYSTLTASTNLTELLRLLLRTVAQGTLHGRARHVLGSSADLWDVGNMHVAIGCP